ncbi:putative sulfate exporter family transporter [Loktanella sp. Alg231-35]|uniref:putative sulfate exporter family transporter n=1 Tax=Loktanella sp. Alg231-35 TaxID=1922220 RepID=UPI001F3470D8|nr:putative sulfate exporter family transporter [Loktanella sp. Alg231-35]
MISQIKSLWDTHFGGALLVCVIAAAATILSEHYGAPAMLFALLIGMAFHFLYDDQKFTPGLEFSAKTLLRLGVGLLGLRLSIGDVENWGLVAVAAVGGFVMATLARGAVLSFMFGRRLAFGLLAGGDSHLRGIRSSGHCFGSASTR